MWINILNKNILHFFLLKWSPTLIPETTHSGSKLNAISKYCINFFQCVPILGRGFETGGYKCECLQGYEYPFEDPITYFDGQLVEAEFLNIVADTPTR